MTFTNRTEANSPYIEWAKLKSHAKFNLATSGVANYPLAKLSVRIEDLEITGAGGRYGYGPLQERLAKHAGVPEECVVAAIGTSMSNFLAYCGTLNAGDDIILEHPAYGPMVEAAEFLGANIRLVHRRFENGFAIDPADVQRAVTPRTRLISLTNLHNPSGVFMDTETLRAIGKIARERGRARHGRRSLSGYAFRSASSLVISSGRAVYRDEQPHKSLWIERRSLRVDTCAEGTCPTHLSNQRFVWKRERLSRRAAFGDRVRSIRKNQGAGKNSARCEPRATQSVPRHTHRYRIRPTRCGNRGVSAPQEGRHGRFHQAICAKNMKHPLCRENSSICRNTFVLESAERRNKCAPPSHNSRRDSTNSALVNSLGECLLVEAAPSVADFMSFVTAPRVASRVSATVSLGTRSVSGLISQRNSKGSRGSAQSFQFPNTLRHRVARAA